MLMTIFVVSLIYLRPRPLNRKRCEENIKTEGTEFMHTVKLKIRTFLSVFPVSTSYNFAVFHMAGVLK